MKSGNNKVLRLNGFVVLAKGKKFFTKSYYLILDLDEEKEKVVVQKVKGESNFGKERKVKAKDCFVLNKYRGNLVLDLG